MIGTLGLSGYCLAGAFTVQIKDLTVDEFKNLIRETIEDALQDLLVDPDAGKSVKASIEQQLLEIRERRQLGKTQTLSSDEARKELVLN
jgi:hypothetical protein